MTRQRAAAIHLPSDGVNLNYHQINSNWKIPIDQDSNGYLARVFILNTFMASFVNFYLFRLKFSFADIFIWSVFLKRSENGFIGFNCPVC